MDEKQTKATQIIAEQISKIIANKNMDMGTVGGQQGWTKRQSEARSMARYFVTRMYGVKFTGELYENWTAEQKKADILVEELAAAAIAITGK